VDKHQIDEHREVIWIILESSAPNLEELKKRMGTKYRIGQTAEIAYVQCTDKREIHLLEGLQLKPGTTVKLHQRYPTFVIEAEGTQIATDDEVVKNIKVWVDSIRSTGQEEKRKLSQEKAEPLRGRKKRRFRLGRRGN